MSKRSLAGGGQLHIPGAKPLARARRYRRHLCLWCGRRYVRITELAGHVRTDHMGQLEPRMEDAR